MNMAIWLPGYRRHEFAGLPGMNYVSRSNPKLCWHTTEGGSVAGAIRAYAPYPPHIVVDPRTGEKVQHISLDRAAYSSSGSDNEYMVQVEVVGYAGQSHTWDDNRLRWLAENVVKPVAAAIGVPPIWTRFYGEGEGIVLASPNSRIRMNRAQIRGYKGHLGHQHLPGPDHHWDPGRLNIARILELAGGATSEGLDMDRNEVTDIVYTTVRNLLRDMANGHDAADPNAVPELVRRGLDRAWLEGVVRDAVAGLPGVEADVVAARVVDAVKGLTYRAQ